MNKYTKITLLCSALTAGSIIVASQSAGAAQIVATASIGVFWIAGLLSGFRRGYIWYVKDLNKRVKEMEEPETEEESAKTETERLFN